MNVEEEKKICWAQVATYLEKGDLIYVRYLV